MHVARRQGGNAAAHWPRPAAAERSLRSSLAEALRLGPGGGRGEIALPSLGHTGLWLRQTQPAVRADLVAACLRPLILKAGAR